MFLPGNLGLVLGICSVLTGGGVLFTRLRDTYRDEDDDGAARLTRRPWPDALGQRQLDDARRRPATARDRGVDEHAGRSARSGRG